MLVHLRMTVPTDLSPTIEALLVEDDRVTNVVVMRGVSVEPVGDAIEADVAREAASDVIDAICATGLPARGSLAFSDVGGVRSDAARAASKAAPGDPDDAVIWNSVVDAARSVSRPSTSYFLFLFLAITLAAIAVITDSAVLVVGAMVVGPEFASVGATCVALVFGEWRTAARAMWWLVAFFAVAIVCVVLLAWIAAATGHGGRLHLRHDRARRRQPRARPRGLAPAEIRGSTSQLAVNIAGMILAGVVTVWLQRVFRPPPRHLAS